MNRLSQIDLFIVTWLAIRALIDMVLIGIKLFGK